MKVKGLYTVKQEGLQKILSDYPNFPAVKRHINNPNSKMQYATALHLYSETNVPVNEIIEIP